MKRATGGANEVENIQFPQNKEKSDIPDTHVEGMELRIRLPYTSSDDMKPRQRLAILDSMEEPRYSVMPDFAIILVAAFSLLFFLIIIALLISLH